MLDALRRTTFVNEATEMLDAMVVFLSNEYQPNEKSESLVQLSPFGDFPNARGMQRVRAEDAQNIANDFNSALNVEARTFGLPWYVGHPDFPGLEQKYRDHAAKGRIKSLVVKHDAGCANCAKMDNASPCREHGLFANVKWNDEGKRLIASEAFHGHSVNWRVKQEGKYFRPTGLKSVGFTNDPQIPVPPITAANEKDRQMKKLMDWVNKLLGTTYGEGDAETAANEVEKFYNEKVKPVMERDTACVKNEQDATAAVKPLSLTLGSQPLVILLANELVKARADQATAAGEAKTEKDRATKLDGEKSALVTDLANERKARVTEAASTLKLQGKLTPAEETSFVNEATTDYAATVAKYGARKGLWAPGQSRVDVASRKPDAQALAGMQERSDKVQELVNERMTKHKETYVQAFDKVKRENPSLFEAMKTPTN
jgi:hypothetical protein